MAILSAQERADARGSAWFLTRSASRYLDGSPIDEAGRVVFINVFRLLESFRGNIFFGLGRSEFEHRVDGLNSSFTGSTEGNLLDVRDALRGSIKAVFSGQDEESAVLSLENSLRKIVRPDKFGDAIVNDRRAVHAFFDEMLRRLAIN